MQTCTAVRAPPCLRPCGSPRLPADSQTRRPVGTQEPKAASATIARAPDIGFDETRTLRPEHESNRALAPCRPSAALAASSTCVMPQILTKSIIQSRGAPPPRLMPSRRSARHISLQSGAGPALRTMLPLGISPLQIARGRAPHTSFAPQRSAYLHFKSRQGPPRAHGIRAAALGISRSNRAGPRARYCWHPSALGISPPQIGVPAQQLFPQGLSALRVSHQTTPASPDLAAS